MTEREGASERRASDPAERLASGRRAERAEGDADLLPALRSAAWQRVLEALPHPVFVLSADGRVRWCNGPALGLLGATCEGTLGAAFDAVLARAFGAATPGMQALAALADGAAAGASRAAECALDARCFDALAVATDDGNGAPLRVVTLTDAGARRDASERLAHEQAARIRAEAATRARDDFLATVSHELRTPLNAMLGWARTLRDDGLEPARRTRALAALERNIGLQTRLVEDLLDAARIAAAKLHVELAPVDLAAIVDAALEVARAAADARGVALHAHLGPIRGPIVGDGQRLQQVVWNLLSNAVKFTPPGGRVTVELASAPEGVALSVRDTGRGIAAEVLPFVFERFHQGDAATTRAHGGLGLGLAIARHIVELHGGTIAAESGGVDRGARFAVTLPYARRGHEPAPPRPDAAGDAPDAPPDPRTAGTSANAAPLVQRLAGLHVLAVDDDDDGRELLTTFLAAEGAHVTAAASGAEALALFARARPDVIVCDIGMPGMDGFALLRTIRALGAARGAMVPAVALTGYASADDNRQALLAGFQLHVAKPVDPDVLVARIEKVVARASGAT